MVSVDRLKSIANFKRGFAKPNQFLVELPPFAGISSDEVNILCSRVSLPGKQILTHDRRINMEFEKVAYGYAVDDVTMSFYLLNDYGLRKYFDDWRSSTINEETLEVAYKETYQRTIKIHQMTRPILGIGTKLGPIRASVDLGTGAAYSIELIDAFPTTIQSVDFSNELDGLLEVSVQISYTNWRRITASQKFINFNLSIT